MSNGGRVTTAVLNTKLDSLIGSVGELKEEIKFLRQFDGRIIAVKTQVDDLRDKTIPTLERRVSGLFIVDTVAAGIAMVLGYFGIRK